MTLKTEMISTTPVWLWRKSVRPGKDWEAVHRALGFDPPITSAGSNNSSAALLAGIPSISTGAGPCDNAHALTENCEIEPFYKGIKKILLLELALAGMQ
jgi:hypothetical protein